MNEIKKIHLGRQPFTISVEAHKELRDYLSAIEARVGTNSEVLKEIEMRMAELLSERGIKGDKVVLSEDIEFLKEQLGKPGDFSDDDAHEAAADEAKTADSPKRLYRDTQHGMIAGVSSGIAAYFGIDPTIVRLIFVVVTLLGGWGILVYIILWLVTPDATSPSERLQMQGKAVTVDSIKELVDRADVKGAADRAGRAAGPAAEKLAQIILAAIGICLIAAASALFAGVMASLSYLVFHRNDLIAGAVAFPVGATESAFVAAALVVGGVISFLLLLMGLSMVKRKSVVPGWITAALIGLLLAGGAVGVAAGPDTVYNIRDRYRAAQHLAIREVEPFTNVSVKGHDISVVYEKSNKYEVGVRYLGKDVTKSVKTQVVNGELIIDASNFKGRCEDFCITAGEFAEIVVRAPKVDNLTTDNGKDARFDVSPGDVQKLPVEIMY